VREAVSNKDTYQQAYVYGFPMLMNYGVMYEYFVHVETGSDHLHVIAEEVSRVAELCIGQVMGTR
jgi:hypothetical protein